MRLSCLLSAAETEVTDRTVGVCDEMLQENNESLLKRTFSNKIVREQEYNIPCLGGLTRIRVGLELTVVRARAGVQLPIQR